MLLLLAVSILCISGISVAMPTEFDYDCTGLPENFIYWWACGSYGVCQQGQYAQVDCINGTAYDRQFRSCVQDTQNIAFPCNSPGQDCVLYNGPGHRYPEQSPDPVDNLPACSFYYTCSYGRYLGHQRCNEFTVYDELSQQCLPPEQVPPPCGTATELDANNRPFSGDFPFQRVQPQVDDFGNPDYNRWPFTNNANGGGGLRVNQNQFLSPFRQNDFNNFANAPVHVDVDGKK